MSIDKRLIVILTFGIMLIGMLTFSTGHPVKSAVVIKPVPSQPISAENTPSEEDKEKEPVPTTIAEDISQAVEATPTPSAVPTPDPNAPNPLRLEIYPEVHDLIEQYLTAKQNGDIDTLRTLVTDPKYLSTETITMDSEYTTGYSNIKCYTKRGGGEIDLVVYVTFNTSLVGIETPIASLESFYITYKDDKPFIFSGLFNEETQQMLGKLDSDKDVLDLRDSVQREVDAATDKDPALKDFWDKLTAAVNSSESTNENGESTTGAPTADSAEPA